VRAGIFLADQMRRRLLLAAASTVLVTLAIAACSSAERARTPSERHCRGIVLGLLGEGASPRFTDISSTRRADATPPVTVVSVTYESGGARRLTSCSYAEGSMTRAIAVTFRGRALSPDELDAANAGAR